MTTITVREPESGEELALHVQEIKNAPYPGWVVLIPQRRNIFIYLHAGEWAIQPAVIPTAFVNEIGEKIKSTLTIKT